MTEVSIYKLSIADIMVKSKVGIVFLAMATFVLLQSCRESTLYPDRVNNPNTNGSTGTISDVYGVEWELEAFETLNGSTLTSESLVPDGQHYTVIFRQEGISGENHCNTYGAEYAVGQNNALTISNMISTQVACTAGSLSNDFAGGLVGATKYEINSDILRIYTGKFDIALGFNSFNALRFKRVQGPQIQLMQLELVDLAASDPYSILNTQVVGDELHVRVQYSGGCKEHIFNLIGPLTIPSGDPTQIQVYLHHRANGDACEALITRDLVYDLTPLKNRWTDITGKSAGTIAMTINTMGSGYVGPLTYRIGGGGIPNWLQDTINAIKSRPVTVPAESILEYSYGGATVYYRPPICCDIFSDLYDGNGNLVCHPDGGIVGTGDGKCSDFAAGRTNEKLIWQDPR